MTTSETDMTTGIDAIAETGSYSLFDIRAPYKGMKDHRAASDVVTRGVFRAGLRRFVIGDALDAWRPEWVCYYFINDSVPPSFAIDVSSHYQQKRDALACHVSQFTPRDTGKVDTRLTSPRFQQLIESRDAHLGALAGVDFAEGILVKEPILRPDIFRA